MNPTLGGDPPDYGLPIDRDPAIGVGLAFVCGLLALVTAGLTWWLLR